MKAASKPELVPPAPDDDGDDDDDVTAVAEVMA